MTNRKKPTVSHLEGFPQFKHQLRLESNTLKLESLSTSGGQGRFLNKAVISSREDDNKYEILIIVL